MFCNNCGAQVPEGKLTCSNCGAYVNSSVNNNYGAQNNYGQANYGQQNPFNSQPDYGQSNPFNSQPDYGQPNTYNNQMQYRQPTVNMSPRAAALAQAERENLGMKWYKFVIYCQLFLNAIINFFMAIMVFNGEHYNEKYSNGSEMVYKEWPKMETLDKVYGVWLLCLVAGAIAVRLLLAGFKKNADRYYLGFLAANFISGIIYVVAASAITDVDLGGMSSSNIAQNIILFALCIMYFNKRHHLFKN